LRSLLSSYIIIPMELIPPSPPPATAWPRPSRREVILWGLALGLLIFWWLHTPDGLTGKAEAIGYAVCHRIEERSFSVAGWQFPLCARCTGMFLGALLGLIFQVVRPNRLGGLPPRRVLLVLGLLAVAFGVDGVNSFSRLLPFTPHLYEPNNILRLLTGTGMGLGIAAVFMPALQQTLWPDWLPESFFRQWRTLGALALLAALLDALVLTGWPAFTLPLAFLSALSVLGLLTLVYAVILIMIFRRDNTFQTLGQVRPFLVGAFCVALTQIGLFDFFRFLLTHTWGGFVL